MFPVARKALIFHVRTDNVPEHEQFVRITAVVHKLAELEDRAAVDRHRLLSINLYTVKVRVAKRQVLLAIELVYFRAPILLLKHRNHPRRDFFLPHLACSFRYATSAAILSGSSYSLQY